MPLLTTKILSSGSELNMQQFQYVIRSVKTLYSSNQTQLYNKITL